MSSSARKGQKNVSLSTTLSLSGPGTNTSHSLAQEHHEAICDGAEDPGVQVLKSDSCDYRLAYPGDPKANFSHKMGGLDLFSSRLSGRRGVRGGLARRYRAVTAVRLRLMRGASPSDKRYQDNPPGPGRLRHAEEAMSHPAETGGGGSHRVLGTVNAGVRESRPRLSGEAFVGESMMLPWW